MSLNVALLLFVLTGGVGAVAMMQTAFARRAEHSDPSRGSGV